MVFNKIIPFPIILLMAVNVWRPTSIRAQEYSPRVFGSFETNANFFIRDTTIGAANTPQYDHQLYGAEAWLNLAYSNWGFDFGLRFDAFHQSNLFNPTGSYTNEGIGNWYVKKNAGKLSLAAGYIYGQIGSGIIYRAYENRSLFIDNALVGVEAGYQFSSQWKIKAFTGRQKQQFSLYQPILKGISAEGYIAGKKEESNWSLAPGIGLVNRTFDDGTMNGIVATLNSYQPADVFVPKYNVYAFSLFNTFSSGPFTLYAETAFKSKDALIDPNGVILTDSSSYTGDKLVSRSGSVFYSSLAYAEKGVGVSLEAKRTENFSFRIRPQETLNQGMIGFLPAMTRINTYRLTARYNAATQELGEWAFQGDLRYAPNKTWNYYLNFSKINTLDQELLYQEIYSEITYMFQKKWSLLAGLQIQKYNQAVYEAKPGVPKVSTITPFAEWLYKIDRKRSVKIEAQWLMIGEDIKAETKQDYGNWLFALFEFSAAPHWSFSISDMYNYEPGKNSPVDASGQYISKHFPRIDASYTHEGNRLSLSYVKQVEGVVCSGGICRLEPAFSGFRFSLQSTF